jgi:hypothetical protein
MSSNTAKWLVHTKHIACSVSDLSSIARKPFPMSTTNRFRLFNKILNRILVNEQEMFGLMRQLLVWHRHVKSGETLSLAHMIQRTTLEPELH